MPAKIREILNHGTWLYDGNIRADVWIIRQNYFDGPKISDEEATAGYPPTDAEGCFYFPEYHIPNAGAGSGGEVFASVEEAIQKAELVIKGLITWDRPFA